MWRELSIVIPGALFKSEVKTKLPTKVWTISFYICTITYTAHKMNNSVRHFFNGKTSEKLEINWHLHFAVGISALLELPKLEQCTLNRCPAFLLNQGQKTQKAHKKENSKWDETFKSKSCSSIGYRFFDRKFKYNYSKQLVSIFLITDLISLLETYLNFFIKWLFF